MFLEVLLVVFLIWLCLALFACFSVIKIYKKYGNRVQVDVPDHYQGLIRQDFGQWDKHKAKILKGCFLRFPWKATFGMSYIVIFAIMSTIRKYLFFPKTIIETFRNYYGRLSLKMCFTIR